MMTVLRAVHGSRKFFFKKRREYENDEAVREAVGAM